MAPDTSSGTMQNIGRTVFPMVPSVSERLGEAVERDAAHDGARKDCNDDAEQELWTLILKTMRLAIEIATEAMIYANDEDASVIGEIKLLLLPEYGERKRAKM